MIVDGIELHLTRKNIKNMHLYVKPPHGAVFVSAPLLISERQIKRFVRNNLAWIAQKQEKIARQPLPPERRYESGETLFVWGEPYLLQVNYGTRYSLELVDATAVFTARRASTPVQRERFIREWYRAQLKSEVAHLLPKWEAVTGLQCAGWQSKYMTSKWGTCNSAKQRIWLNVQLAKRPLECLEYVIVHELVHLRIRNHGAEFKELMSSHLPQWKVLRKKLNEPMTEGRVEAAL
ncbi:MAG: M48 family metallopeptidase [Coriobacteriales bacterium]|jgi:predicted metal-dependent hydrolase|nr:M48 family metallopeptidase [Coriobacteriales bacterium]